jgi:TRAP-type C4-dicarboxylate transport system substrate-binding protein
MVLGLSSPIRRASGGARVVAVAVGIGCALLSSRGLAVDTPTVVLRMATIAPDGTEWARLSRAFARTLEEGSGGSVRVKWYFGGVAGDERAELDRLRRGQLDGIAGAAYCKQLAPSLRALEVAGMIRSPGDAADVLRTLRPETERELAKTPFRALFISLGFGHRVLFSRTPVRSLADLRAGRYWVWEYDDVLSRQLSAIGIHVVPMTLNEAAAAYEDHRIDGFIVIPQAALAFQYSSIVRYYTDLETAYLPGCLVLRTTSVDQMVYHDQTALLEAAAKLKVHFEEAGARQDDQLLGSLFMKQGLQAVPMSAAFRDEWFRATRQAYGKLRDELVPSVAAQQALEAIGSARH